MLSEAVSEVETSPGKVPYKCPLYDYVIARSDRFCRAVAIPRKGSANVVYCKGLNTGDRYHVIPDGIICGMPPQHRYPDHPPLMVKGVLSIVKAKSYFILTTQNF